MTYHYLLQRAQYDCGAYGTSTYNNGQVCAAQTTGPLANTGLDVLVPLGSGLLILVVALVLLLRTLRRSSKTTPTKQ